MKPNPSAPHAAATSNLPRHEHPAAPSVAAPAAPPSATPAWTAAAPMAAPDSPRAQPPQAADSGPRWRDRWAGLAGRLGLVFGPDVVALASRVAVAAIFLQSGRTKVDGWLQVSPGAVDLFRTEYRLPLLAPELAAHLAAYAEHAFPLLLVLGLCTRLSALALLGMTLVIQVFVYPDAWPTHLSWAALLMGLAARGAGRWSLDRALGVA